MGVIGRPLAPEPRSLDVTKRSLAFTIIFAAVFCASACKKDEPAKKAQSSETQEPVAQPVPASGPEAIVNVMKPYEQCRSLLAADKAEGVAECASAIAAAAGAAEGSAPESAKAHLGAIKTAADALAKAPADDIEATRQAFGEVSKPVVALLTAVPEAAKDFHVFECPMAKGYKRWVQPEAKLANPYMGSKMLECGTEVHDHHQGMQAGRVEPGATENTGDEGHEGHDMGDEGHDMGHEKHDMGHEKHDKGQEKHDKGHEKHDKPAPDDKQ
jgi:hypothetical protein